VGRGVIMLLFVEDRGKAHGERCRRDTRELHALRPAALTGGDGDGASREGEGVGESSDQRLIGRTIDWRGGELHHQVPFTHASDCRATRARCDADLADSAGGGWEEGGHGNAQCTMQNYAECTM
jgi:hypothetical protein